MTIQHDQTSQDGVVMYFDYHQTKQDELSFLYTIGAAEYSHGSKLALTGSGSNGVWGPLVTYYFLNIEPLAN
jgi:hypothetical protein